MTPGVQGVAALLPLFRELNALKRIVSAQRVVSIADRWFCRAWVRLVQGESLTTVALHEAAHAVASARLADIDALVLKDAGLTPEECSQVLRRGFDAVATPLDANLRDALRAALTTEPLADVYDDPAFSDLLPKPVHLLSLQPRAGATRPGHARVVLTPTENHAEHCALVAVYGVLAAPLYNADPAQVFLAGLTHHLHNAYLPDAGDAGDALLGEHLQPVMHTFRERALRELPAPLKPSIQASLDAVYRSDTPEARAFQTADVLDRVLEMEWHARSAAFTLDVALHDMDIVHPGPVQAFQQEIMRAIGFSEEANRD